MFFSQTLVGWQCHKWLLLMDVGFDVWLSLSIVQWLFAIWYIDKTIFSVKQCRTTRLKYQINDYLNKVLYIRCLANFSTHRNEKKAEKMLKCQMWHRKSNRHWALNSKRKYKRMNIIWTMRKWLIFCFNNNDWNEKKI